MVRKGKNMIKLQYPINDCIVDDNNSNPIYFDKLIYVKKIEGKRRSYEVKFKSHLNSLSWESTIEINPSETNRNIVIDHTVYYSKKDFKILCEKYPEA